MRNLQKCICSALIAAIIATVPAVSGEVKVNAAECPSGVGLSAHALTAYMEGWQYVWGGTTPGAVDCSGLIASYYGVGGNRTDMLAVSPTKGLVSDGIPRIHGLGLHQPGHVGIYIGSNAAIDARSPAQDVVYQNAYTKGWVEWFKIVGVAYPSDGFVMFNNQAFWYENGEYVINTSRVIDGVTYNFNEFGYADKLPPDSAYAMTDYSNQKAFEQSRAEADKKAQEVEAEKIRKEKREAMEKKRAEHMYDLCLGNTGSCVKAVQELLLKYGYIKEYSAGYFDKNTQTAVELFQEKNGFGVTGVMTRELYEFLADGKASLNDEGKDVLVLKLAVMRLFNNDDETVKMTGKKSEDTSDLLSFLSNDGFMSSVVKSFCESDSAE